MEPLLKYAGLAGILTGVFLAGEFAMFMLSGYSLELFENPEKAIPFLEDKGTILRIAALFGIAGVAVRTVFVVGLASKLKKLTPTSAVATLYFGILGGVGHGLVAFSLYLGIPVFIVLAAGDLNAATNSWGSFAAITGGFQGLGNFLLGLMSLVAGRAIIVTRVLPRGAGWVSLATGVATLLGVFTSGTPMEVIGFMVFMPSLLLAMVFYIWTGIALMRSERAVS